MSHKSPHLRVVGVPDNDGGKALFGPAADNGLDPGHPDAGGVNDAGAGGFQGVTLLRGNAVSPDNHKPFTRNLPFLEDPDAPFLQQLHHLGIVNQGPIGINIGVVFVDGLQDHLHGIFHAHAES